MNSYKYIKGHPSTKENIVIDNDVWIGSDVKILSGVKIGNGAVVGANSLVTNDIPAYCICGGIPAKIICQRFSDDIIAKLEEMKWWNLAEEKIGEIIPLLQSTDVSC